MPEQAALASDQLDLVAPSLRVKVIASTRTFGRPNPSCNQVPVGVTPPQVVQTKAPASVPT